MKNKKFYRIEKINYGYVLLFIIPICIMIKLTALKISNPLGFGPPYVYAGVNLYANH